MPYTNSRIPGVGYMTGRDAQAMYHEYLLVQGRGDLESGQIVWPLGGQEAHQDLLAVGLHKDWHTEPPYPRYNVEVDFLLPLMPVLEQAPSINDLVVARRRDNEAADPRVGFVTAVESFSPTALTYRYQEFTTGDPRTATWTVDDRLMLYRVPLYVPTAQDRAVELEEQLRRLRATWEHDIDRISDGLISAATDNDMCGVYDAAIDDINGNLHGPYRLRERRRDACYSVDLEITGATEVPVNDNGINATIEVEWVATTSRHIVTDQDPSDYDFTDSAEASSTMLFSDRSEWTFSSLDPDIGMSDDDVALGEAVMQHMGPGDISEIDELQYEFCSMA